MVQVSPIVSPGIFWNLGSDPLLQDFKLSDRFAKE